MRRETFFYGCFVRTDRILKTMVLALWQANFVHPLRGAMVAVARHSDGFDVPMLIYDDAAQFLTLGRPLFALSLFVALFGK